MEDARIELSFGGRKIRRGEFVPLEIASKTPNLEWDYHEENRYTLVFYDSDAPYPEESTKSPYLHWMVVNIHDGHLKDGEELISYIPPSPPKDSAPHEYTFTIYRQDRPLRMDKVENRANFQMPRNGLTKIGSFSFKSGHHSSNPRTKSPRRSASDDDDEKPTDHVLRPPTRAVTKGPSKKSGEKYADQSPKAKWSRCVLHVEAKHPDSCTKEDRGTKKCPDPYKVCSKSVHTSIGRGHHISEYVDLDELDYSDLQAYAKLYNEEKGKIIIDPKLPRPELKEKLRELKY